MMIRRTQAIGTSYLRNKFSEIIAERSCNRDKTWEDLICSFPKTYLTSLSKWDLIFIQVSLFGWDSDIQSKSKKFKGPHRLRHLHHIVIKAVR